MRKIYEEIKKTGVCQIPKIIVLEPTYKCNLSCSMCFYNAKRTKKELTAQTFINFFKIVPDLRFVQFTAREPFAKNDFLKIVSYFIKKNIPALFLTNGTLINKNNIHYLQYHKDNIVMLSIDGDRETHDKIRGLSGAFDKTIATIKKIKDKCNVTVVCVIMEENLKSLWKLPRIIKEIGLSKIIFEYERIYTKKIINNSMALLEEDGGFSDIRLKKEIMPHFSEKLLNSTMAKVEKEALKIGVEITYFPSYFRIESSNVYHRKIREKYQCTCNYFKKARVDSEGNFIHCFAYRKSFGNITDKSLEEVWNSEKYRNFRKKLLKNNLLPICETCWAMNPIGLL